MIFFSRFGVASYFYILLAGMLFFALFWFFLSKSKKILACIENSKIINWTTLFVSVVFCASMFAGLKSLFSYVPLWANVLLVSVVMAICLFSAFKGMDGLAKINIILMPIASLLFFAVIISCLSTSTAFDFSLSPLAGLLYCPLYVALNTCMSGFVISKMGEGLTKKQTFFVCLFSTLLLVVFLLFANLVLQQNSEAIYSDMPFLYLTSGKNFSFVLAYVVILIGCLTTLISLCFTIKTSLDKAFKSEEINALLSVFFPFAISSLGFSQIVSFLYPICSVIGIFMLFYLIYAEIRT